MRDERPDLFGGKCTVWGADSQGNFFAGRRQSGERMRALVPRAGSGVVLGGIGVDLERGLQAVLWLAFIGVHGAWVLHNWSHLVDTEEKAPAGDKREPDAGTMGDTSLLLAGMPGWMGPPDAACPHLVGFLDRAERELQAAKALLPVSAEERAFLLAGSCSLEDPGVRARLRPIRGAFGEAGLRPLPPFQYLGED